MKTYRQKHPYIAQIGYILRYKLQRFTWMFKVKDEQHKNDTVVKFRAVPEITHRKWKELNLMSPLRPDETPDFRFQELQMKLYYTIYL